MEDNRTPYDPRRYDQHSQQPIRSSLPPGSAPDWWFGFCGWGMILGLGGSIVSVLWPSPALRVASVALFITAAVWFPVAVTIDAHRRNGSWWSSGARGAIAALSLVAFWA